MHALRDQMRVVYINQPAKLHLVPNSNVAISSGLVVCFNLGLEEESNEKQSALKLLTDHNNNTRMMIKSSPCQFQRTIFNLAPIRSKMTATPIPYSVHASFLKGVDFESHISILALYDPGEKPWTVTLMED
ncbi:uncharacterized protein ARB_07510 [Trichophyton benhamiae CBS 112371]|uniref:Uncharacterized protein n=1 Tax=Arthroderma benhamiae (strain ATCC MYA-4681 / CBS 112371) TaxID=663331 RepID=D4ATE6_ARTBC|nr:uncharacterized protein ARB_07510 [Trichophyton benhamiae CBS 112371]EFE33565.1 hypothetical protein ARB_07510 [Trichophyton benhamiae CBS 112371]